MLKSFKYNNAEFFFGWKKDNNAVARVLSQLQHPFFSGAAPHLKGTGENKDVFFWEAEQKVLGQVLNSWDQGQVGSCVSHGSGRAAQDLLIVQIALGAAEEWEGHEVAREPIYGGSRCEVGGQYGDYSDGSVGAWAAEWLNKWGIVLGEKYDSVDLSSYNETRCRDWGAKGVPSDIETIAKQHHIQTTMVSTVTEARDALANGYPISICGSLGRTMQRQAGGWCPVSGAWAHCQALRGVCTVKGGTPAFVYQNSWGDYLGNTNNVVTLESGRQVTLPQGCYLSDFDSVGRELKQQDTFAYSQAVGWPAQTISWLV
jgi:hypothetical protein